MRAKVRYSLPKPLVLGGGIYLRLRLETLKIGRFKTTQISHNLQALTAIVFQISPLD
ncbi:MAG: hypothetical protein ACXACA_03475 [Candidatus Ranarchaeia archaeon]